MISVTLSLQLVCWSPWSVRIEWHRARRAASHYLDVLPRQVLASLGKLRLASLLHLSCKAIVCRVLSRLFPSQHFTILYLYQNAERPRWYSIWGMTTPTKGRKLRNKVAPSDTFPTSKKFLSQSTRSMEASRVVSKVQWVLGTTRI